MNDEISNRYNLDDYNIPTNDKKSPFIKLLDLKEKINKVLGQKYINLSIKIIEQEKVLNSIIEEKISVKNKM